MNAPAQTNPNFYRLCESTERLRKCLIMILIYVGLIWECVEGTHEIKRKGQEGQALGYTIALETQKTRES